MGMEGFRTNYPSHFRTVRSGMPRQHRPQKRSTQCATALFFMTFAFCLVSLTKAAAISPPPNSKESLDLSTPSDIVQRQVTSAANSNGSSSEPDLSPQGKQRWQPKLSSTAGVGSEASVSGEVTSKREQQSIRGENVGVNSNKLHDANPFRYDTQFAGAGTVSGGGRKQHVSDSRLGQEWQSPASQIGQLLFGSKFSLSKNTTPLCYSHMEIFFRELRNFQPWALQMLDASAKVPSGLLQGNMAWWGSYSECLDVQVGLNSTTYPGLASTEFTGQYSTVNLRVDAIKMQTTNRTETILVRLGLLEEMAAAGSEALSISMGLCLPSTCSADDTQINVQALLDSLQLPVVATTQSCQSKTSHQLDIPAYVVICIFSFVFLLILMGTFYEVFKTSSWLTCGWVEKKKTSATNGSSNDPLSANSNSADTMGNFGRFLMCFSAITNIKSIMTVGPANSEQMTTLHGVRFLSMSWIILGHTYFVGMISSPLWDNPKDFMFLPANFAFQGVLRGIFSVDTFLFLSGLLVVYVGLKKIKANDGRFNILEFYLHRILRIAPVYLMVIAWVAGPSDYVLAGGPMWSQMVESKNNCRETWWKNILFISNFGDTTKMCVQHSWYISLDTQLYVISPFLLYPMARYPRLGVFLTVLCIVVSCTTAGIISYSLGLPSSSLLHTVPVNTLIAYAKEFYIKPYCRMGPYAVGMLFGFLLVKADLKSRVKQPMTYVLWILAITSNLSILYGTYGQFIADTPPSVLESAIYNGLSGTVWTIGVGWLICACVIGQGGIVNTILSWRAWVPLSRLTYCAYLLHMLVQYTFYDSRENKFHFDHLLMVTLFAGFMIITYGTSLIFSVAFEAPVIRLERLALSWREKKPPKNSSTNL